MFIRLIVSGNEDSVVFVSMCAIVCRLIVSAMLWLVILKVKINKHTETHSYVDATTDSSEKNRRKI